jgi:S-DNA-T family DNA segregation ATPase FtsK/SpoIIIE
MAFQTRSRDPLFDQATSVALERRAQELVGLALVAGTGFLALALASYNPTDPSFLGTSTTEPRNWLGHFGAYTAAPFYVILGLGSWAMVAACAVWGVRFVLHLGEERAFGRAIFAPVWVAIAALYAATCPPGPDWVHSFGLGGLFGDTALGVLLGLLPVLPATGLILSASVLAVVLVVFGFFVLGFTRSELGGILRFLGLGAAFAYGKALSLVGRGAARPPSARRCARLRAARPPWRRTATPGRRYSPTPTRRPRLRVTPGGSRGPAVQRRCRTSRSKMTATTMSWPRRHPGPGLRPRRRRPSRGWACSPAPWAAAIPNPSPTPRTPSPTKMRRMI